MFAVLPDITRRVLTRALDVPLENIPLQLANKVHAMTVILVTTAQLAQLSALLAREDTIQLHIARAALLGKPQSSPDCLSTHPRTHP